MLAYFYDRHTGIAGAGVPLPRTAAAIAREWEGTTGDPAVLVAELAVAFPDGEVKDTPPFADRIFREPSEEGMITLTYPADGYPRHSWRVLKYRLAEQAS